MKSQELDPLKGYKNISDFRADLEGLLFPDRRVSSYNTDLLQKINSLEIEIGNIKKALKYLGE